MRKNVILLAALALSLGGCAAVVSYDPDGTRRITWGVSTKAGEITSAEQFGNTAGGFLREAGPLLTAIGLGGAGGVVGLVSTLVGQNKGEKKGRQIEQYATQKADNAWVESETTTKANLMTGQAIATGAQS